MPLFVYCSYLLHAHTVKTLLQAAASIHFDEIFGQFYLAKFESYLVVRLLFKGGF